MLKFIIDTQLPPSLALKLNEFEFDAIHTTYFKNGHLITDAGIRAIAVKENRIIVTKDSDFFDYYILKGAPPKIPYWNLGI